GARSPWSGRWRDCCIPPWRRCLFGGERTCVASGVSGCTNMANTNDRRSESSTEARPALRDPVPAEAKDRSSAATADPAAHPVQPAGPTNSSLAAAPPEPPAARPPRHRWRRWLLLAAAVAGLAAGGYFLVGWVDTALNTVSTDDAYVNGHVTFVAPRVG